MGHPPPDRNERDGGARGGYAADAITALLKQALACALLVYTREDNIIYLFIYLFILFLFYFYLFLFYLFIINNSGRRTPTTHRL